MADCLDSIIGLTQNDCSCYGSEPGSWTEDNKTDTGFYITDTTEGFTELEHLHNAIDCGGGADIFEALTTARSKAIEQFRTDLGVTIRTQFNNSLSYDTTLGRLSHSGAASQNGAFVGVRIRPLPFRYAELVITKVYLGLNASESVNVVFKTNADRYVDGDNTFTEVTVPFTTVANKFVAVDRSSNPIVLPMYNARETEEELKYFAVYEMPSGASPLNNTFTCCGNRQKWHRHLLAEGFTAPAGDVDTLDDVISGQTGSMGLVLEGYVQCKVDSFLCDLESMGEWETAKIVARTVGYKASAILYQKVLDSAKINRFTLENPERLETAAMEMVANYNHNIQWIAHNLPRNAKDCLNCKAGQDFKKIANLL